MDEKQLIKEIYDKCRYNVSLSADDLDAMPEQYEHGKVDGIHNASYQIIYMIEDYWREKGVD